MADGMSLDFEDRATPWLAAIPAAIDVELATVAQVLARDLLGRAEAAVDGGVLEVRSGALLDSLPSEVGVGADGFVASVSTDAPQAGILEYGGTTAPHDILPTVAQALRFEGGVGAVFASVVHDPGATIASHSFLRAPLDAMTPEIVAAQVAAVRRGLARA